METHENGINGGDTDSESVELNPLRRTRFHVNRVDSLEGRASLLGEQETKKSSLRYMTREALPRLDNYRNIMSIQAAHRPSLDELHNPTLLNKVRPNDFFEGSIVATRIKHPFIIDKICCGVRYDIRSLFMGTKFRKARNCDISLYCTVYIIQSTSLTHIGLHDRLNIQYLYEKNKYIRVSYNTLQFKMIMISEEFYFTKRDDDIAKIAKNVNIPHDYGTIMKRKVRDVGDKPKLMITNDTSRRKFAYCVSCLRMLIRSLIQLKIDISLR